MNVKKAAFLAILLFAGSARATPGDDVPGNTKSDSPKLDAFGDPLPQGACVRFGTIRARHYAKAIAFLDKDTIVSVGKSIRFWDAASGRLLREHCHEKMQDSEYATITADGKRAIVGYRNCHYRVWDIATGKLEREFENESDS